MATVTTKHKVTRKHAARVKDLHKQAMNSRTPDAVDSEIQSILDSIMSDVDDEGDCGLGNNADVDES